MRRVFEALARYVAVVGFLLGATDAVLILWAGADQILASLMFVVALGGLAAYLITTRVPGVEPTPRGQAWFAPRARWRLKQAPIVAKRKDIPGPRLEKIKLPEPIKELVKPDRPKPPESPKAPAGPERPGR